MTENKHPPMETFDDEGLVKAAEKMMWEARRLVKTDARSIRNLTDFCKFFFEYLPHKVQTRIESTITTWQDSGESQGDKNGSE